VLGNRMARCLHGKVSRRKGRKMNALLSATAAPQLFEFLDRGATEMPANYLPSAPGVLFVGKDILNGIGHVPGSYRPRGWRRHLPRDYRMRVGKHDLVIRNCGHPPRQPWTIQPS